MTNLPPDVQAALGFVAMMLLGWIWKFFWEREKSPKQRERERREENSLGIDGDW